MHCKPSLTAVQAQIMNIDQGAHILLPHASHFTGALCSCSMENAHNKHSMHGECMDRMHAWGVTRFLEKRHLCRKVIDVQNSNERPGKWLQFEKCWNLPTSMGKKLRRCRISGQNWSSVHAARLSRSALTRASCSGDALPAQLLSSCSCNQLKMAFMFKA